MQFMSTHFPDVKLWKLWVPRNRHRISCTRFRTSSVQKLNHDQTSKQNFYIQFVKYGKQKFILLSLITIMDAKHGIAIRVECDLK